ncbi:hypothetical protein [Fibrella forsythiae]|uniref:Lipoprotein n=1 Tax=Fibrella forsythiae TaxID=2817061 RepID=A0ABS3JHZ1_9BACT|nr:hypothetical protein [Fibrella forsythiae]MBO0949627.1 hypothetical protein [Fibrella forsythiae]
MKIKYLLCIGGLLIFLAGCTIKREVIQPSGYDFSTDILRLVPAETIAKVRELGVTIYEGRNPPNIEGAYLLAPLYMTKSSVPNEPVKPDGFNDYKIKVYAQNSANLTASLDTKSISKSTGSVAATSTGQGTYLAGNGNFFSLFVILETKRTTNTTRSRTVEVYSGELTTTGIRNLESTLFMLEDYGDPNNELIPINTGRAFKDSDGFSERITNFRLAATASKPEQGRITSIVPDGL